MIVPTILTKTVRIYRTTNVGRARIEAASEIANDIAHSFNILLLWISAHPLVKATAGVGLNHRQPPTVRSQSLTIARPEENQQK
jgi:hypothetical protein